MKKIILFAIFLICACVVKAQSPTGVPQLFNGKWYKFNQFLGVDSALLVNNKDTNWLPRQPALVFWQNNGYDTAFWYHNGKRWNRIGGYIDTVYWNIKINKKQDLITLTTTGTTGPSTLIGGALNIPNYGSALTGYVPYVGATANVDLGAYQLNANTLKSDFLLQIKNTPYSITPTSDYTSITPDKSGFVFYTSWLQGSTTYTQSNRFMYANPSLQNNTRQYNLPIRDGTLALLEDQIDTTSLSNRINLKADKATTLTINGVTYNLSANRTWTIPGTDTTSLSNRINLKLNISDTAAMLSPYLRKVDTASLSNRINLKADKATTLTINGDTYDLSANRSWTIPTTDTTSLSNRINLKLNISDTAAMLSPYQIAINARVKYTDTASMLAPYLRKLDTASLSNRINLKQDILSLTTTGNSGPATLTGATLNIPQYQGLLTNPITGTGTINTVAKFTSTTAIGNSNIKDDGNVVTVSTTAGSFGALQVGSYNGNILMNTTNSAAGLIFQNTSSSNKLWDISSYNNDLNFNESNIAPPRVILKAGGDVIVSNLAGSGTRMVVADASGALSSQAIIDTTSLSNRINTKLNISDTASMLSPYLKSAVTSVGLSMPNAFNVTNSPITSTGTIAVTGAGTAAQYIRGDGQLATLPTTTGSGSSVNYYLNGGVSQGTIGGSTYYEMSKDAITSTSANFDRTNAQGNGLIAQFITDVNDPNRLEIPAGAWNFELFFSASSSGGTPAYYVELLKYDGSTFTLIASNSTTTELITGGTATDLYLSSLAVPYTTLAVTDRLVIRVYVITSGKTITLHTQNGNLCQIVTTFAGGLSSLNGLTANTQYLSVGTAGTDFAISSLTDTHTFNLPTASATNRGALSSADWSTFNGKMNYSDTASLSNRINAKQNTITLTTTGTSGAATFSSNTLNIPQYQAAGTYVTSVTGTSPIVSSGGTTPAISIPAASSSVNGYLSSTDWTTFNNKLSTASAASTYVPYTGATGSVTLGSYGITAASGVINGNLKIESDGIGNTALMFKNNLGSAYFQNTAGYSSIYASSTTALSFINNIGSSNYKSFIIESSGLTSNTTRTYTLPDATGTIALVGGSGVGTVTSVAALTLGTSGTDLSSTVANSTTTPVITLNVPTASATNRGALSSTDWSTFNNKQNNLTNPVTGTGTTNYLPKFTGTSTIGNSAITDDGSTVTLVSRALSMTQPIYLAGDMQAIKLRAGTSTGYSYLRFYNSADATRFYLGLFNSGGVDYGLLDGSGYKFEIAGTPIVLNNNAYNVLIGTPTDAGYKLDVNGTGRFSGNLSVLSSTYDGGAEGVKLGYDASYYNAIAATFSSAAASNKMTFVVNSGNGTRGNVMTLVGNGNVGIGTTSPSWLLNLEKNSSSSGAGQYPAMVINNPNAAGYSALYFFNNTTNVGGLEYNNSTTNLLLNSYGALIFQSGNGTERLRITIGGVLDMSNNSTTFSIGSISGKNRIQWDSGTEFAFLNTSNQYAPTAASAFNVRSDYRLKEDLKEVNGLQKVLSIKTYDFKWIDSKLRQDGVLAHELQEILPYAVSGTKDQLREDGTIYPQGVDYGKIVPVLIKAIQELSAQIKELQTKIQTLENK